MGLLKGVQRMSVGAANKATLQEDAAFIPAESAVGA